MARHAKSISQGNTATEHLGVGVLALCFPLQKVTAIIAACDKGDKRVRDLPAALMVYYVIALSLFPGVAYQSVLRWLLGGLQWLGNHQFRVACKEALSNARQRLGALPMKKLHEEMALPMAEKSLPGSYFKDMLLVAFDGSTLALQDTAANATEFGRSSNQNGASAWPLARFVVLVECGTHLIFGASLGGYKDSEIHLAKPLTPRLRKGMLCMADRFFSGYEIWKQFAATEAHLLWRAKISLLLEKIEVLADGSYLAKWLPKEERKKGSEAVIVRVIEYRLMGPGVADDQGEIYRLITTILDPAMATAAELAALYPQRWEIEITIKEGKTILRKGRITLRSKIPELVKQEFWGMILAHYLVRKMMAQAALDKKRDPDELSYEGSIEIIKSTQTGPVLNISP
ncbi:MAG: IS4 family transposase [Akkermansiaceae bacterium]|nr:IS4 family transposase [Akkermansiaceae bacterium]MBJ7423054.1 IS4 family transposase [Akkermansiaceae bacterium]